MVGGAHRCLDPNEQTRRRVHVASYSETLALTTTDKTPIVAVDFGDPEGSQAQDQWTGIE